MTQPLRVVILKPSKYTADGYVERFRWGFMPNSTVPYLRSMTPLGCRRHVHRSSHGGRVRSHGPAVPGTADSAPRLADALGAGGRAKPSVPSGAGSGGLCPSERLHGRHRRASRDDLRHLDVARLRSKFCTLRSGTGLVGDPARRGPGRNAACLWPAATMAAGGGIADHRAACARTCAGMSCRCWGFTRLAGVRSFATSAR